MAEADPMTKPRSTAKKRRRAATVPGVVVTAATLGTTGLAFAYSLNSAPATGQAKSAQSAAAAAATARESPVSRLHISISSTEQQIKALQSGCWCRISFFGARRFHRNGDGSRYGCDLALLGTTSQPAGSSTTAPAASGASAGASASPAAATTLRRRRSLHRRRQPAPTKRQRRHPSRRRRPSRPRPAAAPAPGDPTRGRRPPTDDRCGERVRCDACDGD